MFRQFKFLHTHPRLEERLGLEPEHGVVDLKDLEEALKILKEFGHTHWADIPEQRKELPYPPVEIEYIICALEIGLRNQEWKRVNEVLSLLEDIQKGNRSLKMDSSLDMRSQRDL